MAKCPACDGKLRIWHMKAECPHCAVNIPNHDWENRLEQDANEREAAFFKLNTTLKKLKYVTVGTPLRIIRLVFSVLPILGYIVPLACLKLQNDSISVDISNINAIAFFTNKNFKIADILKWITSDLSVESNKLALLSLGSLLLSLLFGILALAFIPILCKKVKQPVTTIFHLISIVLYLLAPFFFGKFVAASGAEGTGLWGIYVGIALFAAAAILDGMLLLVPFDEREYKYVPVDDVLQREYAVRIGAIEKDEMPFVKESKKHRKEA